MCVGVPGCRDVRGARKGAGASVCDCAPVGCTCKDMGVGVESLCGSDLADPMAARAVEHSPLLPVVSIQVRLALLALVEGGGVSGGGSSSADLRWMEWSLDLKVCRETSAGQWPL